MNLKTSVSNLSKVGKVVSGKLKKLGIETACDLIFYYPFRYDDFSRVLKIADLRPGLTASVKGKIQLIQNKRSPRKRMYITEALIADETGTLKIIWFNQPFITRTLKIGDEACFSGRIESDYLGLQFTSPTYEKIYKNKSLDTTHTARIIPIYALTAGLTEKQLRYLIKSVLPIADKLEDHLPDDLKKKEKLINLEEAITEIHFPSNWENLKKAQKRLKFDELFIIQLANQKSKRDLEKNKADKIIFNENKTKEFVKSLPFQLTDDQKKVAWKILQDMEKNKPMNRLLEGDVGSGKTVVAVMALLNVVINKAQAVFMAPTEILARQHFNSISQVLKDFDMNISLFTRADKRIKDKKISKAKLEKAIKEGEIDIIIGTHALIQENVEFKSLSLAIIDEQHRFGVNQRKTLCDKSGNKKTLPHLLSMTATPIPRTLALALYGDLDLSIINQMPKNRKPIITKLVDEINRIKAYEFIQTEIRKGRQVFVICPLISESDKLGVKSVEEEYEKLNKEIFKDLKIGMLHGKLKASQKEEIMKDFADNKINILVSTSVVEVGVDIPNSTIMVIEGAERFGLAQLHQFRGRVGRGEYQSYCLLFSETQSEKTKERLEALVDSNNGFELAEMDLKLRGPGEVYGKRQSGLPELKIASLTDWTLIKKAQDISAAVLDEDPELERNELLREKLVNFQKNVHFE